MTIRPTQRYWFWILVLGDLVILLTPNIGKIRPGGPFVSVFGDAIPIVVFVVMMIAALQSLRDNDAGNVILAIVLTIPALVVFVARTKGVLLFWMDPYARGDLFGW